MVRRRKVIARETNGKKKKSCEDAAENRVNIMVRTRKRKIWWKGNVCEWRRRRR